MSSATCPICKANARPRSENPAFPFCCARCKQVDLGAWLDEKYRIASETDGSPSDEEDAK